MWYTIMHLFAFILRVCMLANLTFNFQQLFVNKVFVVVSYFIALKIKLTYKNCVASWGDDFRHKCRHLLKTTVIKTIQTLGYIAATRHARPSSL